MCDRNLRDAILRKKAWIAEKEATLARPPVNTMRGGVPLRTSMYSRFRLQEDVVRAKEALAELETGLLRREFDRCKDPSARLSIARELEEHGSPRYHGLVARVEAEQRGLLPDGLGGWPGAAKSESLAPFSSEPARNGNGDDDSEGRARRQVRRPGERGHDPVEERRRKTILAAIEQNITGKGYCAYLDQKGVQIRLGWWRDVPSKKYSDAYKIPKYRRRIYQEKNRVSNSLKHTEPSISLPS